VPDALINTGSFRAGLSSSSVSEMPESAANERTNEAKQIRHLSSRTNQIENLVGGISPSETDAVSEAAETGLESFLAAKVASGRLEPTLMSTTPLTNV
jgi:hypothetical protein